ncbi:hypothetical protein MPTK1_2g04750 [Marchantia polymorpha subsp. ruderalis]|uniref:UspA domain-containing protein n=2 Tax=Marchantia polymorpha TaxID=3197 RepID=A0A176W2C1_MARPO|nr:hypothetical protein AXG93_4324s1230 [Marchantia polymorpha subsp. ruderalis]PTQ42163.1 hypothetical protein MARPO_0031s0130 [Marchantia polymorpha]BBN01114.1 hypothetical protein Mp_2g04750 [Marchantia polymorpha subsp. ruderalis]|eukprot:PTQ42163.1 hypothetical protein MARPO_0031s0130 [Marchantia polymorpha]
MDALLGEPRTVLIALDQSPGAEFAFDWAVKNYCKANDIVHLLYVRRTIDDIGQWRLPGDVAARVEQEAEAGAAALLQKYIERASQAKLICRGRTVVGDEREEICKEVLWVCADVLIVGSRGLNCVTSVVRRVLLGSVSDYCAQNSACPVIVVKPSSVNKGTDAGSVDASCEMHITGLDTMEDT